LENRLAGLARKKQINLIIETDARTTFPEGLAAEFNERFDHDPALRPFPLRAWLGSVPLKSQTLERSRTIIIFVKKNPAFVAVRYGAEAQYRALIGGLVLNSRYMAIQQKSLREPVQALSDLLALLDQRFPAPSELTRFERIALSLWLPEVTAMLNDFAVADVRISQLSAQTLMLQLHEFVSRYVPHAILRALSVLVLVSIVVTILSTWIQIALRDRPVFNAASRLTIEVVAAVTSSGALLRLSSGRLEDHLFIEHVLGSTSDSVSHLFLSAEIAARQTGIWLGLVGGFVVSLSALPEIVRLHALAFSHPELQKLHYELRHPSSGGKVVEALKMLCRELVKGEVVSIELEKPFTTMLRRSFVAMLNRFESAAPLALLPLGMTSYWVVRSLTGLVVQLPLALAEHRRIRKRLACDAARLGLTSRDVGSLEARMRLIMGLPISDARAQRIYSRLRRLIFEDAVTRWSADPARDLPAFIARAHAVTDDRFVEWLCSRARKAPLADPRTEEIEDYILEATSKWVERLTTGDANGASP
jgi:hypothetical protein